MFLDSETTDIFLKLILAAFLGAIVGIERKLAHKTAGMRTFSLVCLGSTLFTIISQIAAKGFLNDAQFTGAFVDTLKFDPARIAAQIVVGVGFIGAGLIILRENRITGLTTAAGLWAVSAIGMAIGYDLVKIAIFTTILIIFIFVILWTIENKLFDNKNQTNSDA